MASNLFFALLILAFITVLDLDRPRGGAILVSQKARIEGSLPDDGFCARSVGGAAATTYPLPIASVSPGVPLKKIGGRQPAVGGDPPRAVIPD